MQITGASPLQTDMRLTGTNTRCDAGSGAFIVQQSDEMKLLMQLMQKIDSLDKKLDALIQEGRCNCGRKMGNE